MRFVHITIDVDRLIAFQQMYARVIVAELEKTQGCLYAGLLQSAERPGVGISLTLWSSASAAEQYERSGAYDRLLAQAKPFFPETSDWTVHLSEDFRVEYVPVERDPVIETYSDPTDADAGVFTPASPQRLFIRIVALHVRPGMLEDFNNAYRNEIIPALRRVAGCRYAHLTGRRHEPEELISVTIWNSRAEAEAYEASGAFKALTEKVNHTLLAVPPPPGASTGGAVSVASGEMSVTGYTLLVGKAFDPGTSG
ncbi:MAG TPA: antibiotic biosynthesis monooxygenase family protein [Bacteroidota bacterium]|nr:antibiotic biosynthesis monooxygenase family protein [Bacteroidota bacterium]